MKRIVLILLTSVLILILILEGPNITVNAGSRTWTVDDDGPADFNTMQAAINAATDGDIILVFSGTYNENVTIGKSLTLKGENVYTTIINGLAAYTVIHIAANNVALTNFTIKNGFFGVLIDSSNNIRVISNVITDNDDGVWIAFSSGNIINDNTIAHNAVGIYLDSSNNTTLNHNTITNNAYGIDIENCRGNLVTENKINLSSIEGIFAYYSDDGRILRNTVQNNSLGIHLDTSNGNDIYQNNFIDNSDQAYVENSDNNWDNGSKGNYWSDYNGTDLNQNGIGDTPYIINADNIDRYPLMNPIIFHDIAITDVACSKTVVGQGFTLSIDVAVQNQGDFTETFNVTVYANTTNIGTQHLTLAEGNSITVTFTWNTDGFAKGNYTIGAYVWPVPGETDTADNTLIDGWIKETIQGDVTGDFKVDILDIATIAKAYGAYPGHLKWDPNADLDDNNKIDIIDIAKAAKNYGKTDP